MVTHELLEVARLWAEACEKAKVESAKVYWSDEDPEGYTVTARDREGILWNVVKPGGSDDD